MILDLTIENLQSFCLNKDLIDKIYNTKENYSLQCNELNLYISVAENKIYTDTDFYRQMYLIKKLEFPYNAPNLVPEYFDLSLKEYLKTSKEQLTTFYNEKLEITNFIESQKEWIDEVILYWNINKLKKEKGIKLLKTYLTYLKDYNVDITPQQIEAGNTDEVVKEMHNNIFKDEAFELWEHYKVCKNVNANSRTDLRLLFELMKADKLLVDTVELKHYIKWLNLYFDTENITELKSIDLKTKLNIQRTNDYKQFKKRP